MTDAITPPPRPAQSDSLLRKALDKAAKSTDATGMPVLQGGGAPPRMPVKEDSSADLAGFGDLRGRINQEPEFDRAKVDAIRYAIHNGQYPLDPRRIAESFVAIEQLISD